VASRAECLVVNTCGFIDAAKEESIDALLDATGVAAARGARLAAVGCLVERYRAELAAELPEVDLWCGLDTTPLLTALDEWGGGESTAASGDRRVAAAALSRNSPRPVSSYVKISDGCDRRCAYCAIPAIKGDYALVPPAAVLAEGRAALAEGARELVLVGQDTSRYAAPGYGGLGRLLGDLAGLGAEWLRVLYLQPDGIDERLLEALAAHALPYVDVPLQHASRHVLRAMGRTGEGEAYLALLERVRAALPAATVRTTFLVGFPGETEADVDELVDFIEAARPALAGVFAFDPQEGTAAARLPQVPTALRLERAARVGEVVDRVTSRYWEGLVGARVQVLVERGARVQGAEAVGRIAAQAPDVDGLAVLIGRGLRRGQLRGARVVAAQGYDVTAEVDEV
jgi:ribosomal protein S12 methylthiotransferase